jgi:hypothetical protein
MGTISQLLFHSLSRKNYHGSSKVPAADMHQTAVALWSLLAEVNLPSYH